LARLFAKNAFEEVHRLSDKYHWKEGGPEKVALHAAIGEITAQLAGNPNGSGALASGINELAIKKIIDKVGKDNPGEAQMISAVLGATVNTLTGKPKAAGASNSSFATKYNAQKSTLEYGIDAVNHFQDFIMEAMNQEDQIKMNTALAAGAVTTIAFLSSWTKVNAPEAYRLSVVQGETVMIGATVIGNIDEAYSYIKIAYENSGKVVQFMNERHEGLHNIVMQNYNNDPYSDELI